MIANSPAATGEELQQTLAVEYGAKVTIGERITAEISLCMMCVDVTAEKTSG